MEGNVLQFVYLKWIQFETLYFDEKFSRLLFYIFFFQNSYQIGNYRDERAISENYFSVLLLFILFEVLNSNFCELQYNINEYDDCVIDRMWKKFEVRV